MRYLLLITLPFYILDQLTKWWIVLNFHLGEIRPVIPGFFDLVHVTNTGSAFGMFSNNNLFFVVLSAVTLIILAICARKNVFKSVIEKWAVALLVSGILGNFTDRLIHKHVIDFLSFDLHVRYANPWPSFNVADSAICVAVGLFFLQSFLEMKEQKKPAEN